MLVQTLKASYPITVCCAQVFCVEGIFWPSSARKNHHDFAWTKIRLAHMTRRTASSSFVSVYMYACIYFFTTISFMCKQHSKFLHALLFFFFVFIIHLYRCLYFVFIYLFRNIFFLQFNSVYIYFLWSLASLCTFTNMLVGHTNSIHPSI